jgi:hypothetical protein
MFNTDIKKENHIRDRLKTNCKTKTIRRPLCIKNKSQVKKEMKGQFKDAKGVIRKFKPYIMFLQSEIVCDTKEKLLFFTFIFSMSEGTRLVSSTN